MKRISIRRDEIGVPRKAIRFNHPERVTIEETPVWTDDYSNLFGVLRARKESRTPR